MPSGTWVFVTQVKDWNEDEHPRDDHGRFTSGDSNDGLGKVVEASPEEYAHAFSRAMDGNPYKAFVSDHSPEEIRSEHMTPLLANGGKTGVLVHDHGDGRIEGTALFNDGPKGAGVKILQYAINHYGVNYVEAYGPHLPKLYGTLGFKDTGVYPFDRSLASPDWNYEQHGEPDYHTMALKTEGKAMHSTDKQIKAHMADPKWDDDAWAAELRRLVDEACSDDDSVARMTPAQRDANWQAAWSRL